MTAVEPSTVPGWLNLTVSLEPGRSVIVSVPERTYHAGTVAAILATLPAIYQPAGLTADLYAPEEPSG